MTTVYVEKGYKRSFDNVTTLLKSSFGTALKEKLSVYSDGDKIVYGDTEFIMDGGEKEISSFARMTESGASWFEGIKGGKQVADTGSKWIELVSEVAKLFHKKYPVIEYAPIDKDYGFQPKTVLEKIVSNFLPQLSADKFDIKPLPERKLEEYFGVSLCLKMHGGTGAPVPCLGKVYFKSVKNRLTAVKKNVAGDIERFLKEVDVSAPTVKGVQGAEEIIDSALNALQACVGDGEQNLNFADYLYYSPSETTIKNLLFNSKHEDVVLFVTDVQVKAISHVYLKTFAFDVYEGNSPRYRISVGLNDNLTLQCLSCGENIIENNKISYFVGDEQKVAYIDLKDGNLGLDDETIAAILNGGVFSSHHMQIVCPQNVRAGMAGCIKTKCMSSAVRVDNINAYKCKDCPYPEVIFTLDNGERVWTKDLVISKRNYDIVLDKKENTKVCSVCGRRFTSSEPDDNLCPTCLKSVRLSADTLADAQREYRKYSQLLPLNVRVWSATKRKYCFSDEEIIVFVIGSDKWIFNKLDAMKKGFVRPPKKVRS